MAAFQKLSSYHQEGTARLFTELHSRRTKELYKLQHGIAQLSNKEENNPIKAVKH